MPPDSPASPRSEASEFGSAPRRPERPTLEAAAPPDAIIAPALMAARLFLALFALLGLGWSLQLLYQGALVSRALERSEAHLDWADVDAARGVLARAAAAVPQSAELQAALGRVEAMRGRWGRPEASSAAVEAYNRAAALDPLDADAFAGLAWAYLDSGQPEEGLAALQRALRLDPHNRYYLISLGEALQRAGRTAEAVAAFEAAQQVQASREVAARISELTAGGGEP